VLQRFLTARREAVLPGRAGGNVYSIRDGRTGYAPATINRRLAAFSALFAFRQMRDPAARNPVPRGRAARMAHGEARRPVGARGQAKARSGLRVREPRRLPRGLTRAESAALLASFRTWRDRAIAGLMLLSGLRSAEVLGLLVTDVEVCPS
jgi:integrase